MQRASPGSLLSPGDRHVMQAAIASCLAFACYFLQGTVPLSFHPRSVPAKCLQQADPNNVTDNVTDNVTEAQAAPWNGGELTHAAQTETLAEYGELVS